jgi:hypothetical protein
MKTKPIATLAGAAIMAVSAASFTLAASVEDIYVGQLEFQRAYEIYRRQPGIYHPAAEAVNWTPISGRSSVEAEGVQIS